MSSRKNLFSSLAALLFGAVLALAWQACRPETKPQPPPAAGGTGLTEPSDTPKPGAAPSPSPAPAPGQPEAVTRALALADDDACMQQLKEALHVWGRNDLAAAGAFALNQTRVARGFALAAVIKGAVTADADATVRYVEQLAAREPQNEEEFGGLLIFALGEIGRHDRAATWALGRPRATPDNWLSLAYYRWAEHDPAEAYAGSFKVTDARQWPIASRAALRAWAYKDHLGLAEAARTLSPDTNRGYALDCALRVWAEKDLEQAKAWLEANKASFDSLPREDWVHGN